MKTLLASLVLTFSLTALADGFKCEQIDHNININVFNKTNPSEGVRNAAIMIFSDASISYGRKTIATFSSEKNKLDQTGTSYSAKVDLRVKESNRAGENLLGTKLGQLKEIHLTIDHFQNFPSRDGGEKKRNF
jgi:hypothetical protein